jgi:hypothetical protein
VLLYALLQKWTSVDGIVGPLNSLAREVVGANGPVRAQWPHWDLYDQREIQLLTYLLRAFDMPLIFDIPEAAVRDFCHAHATAKQKTCTVWSKAVAELGGAPTAVVQPHWRELAFEGELEVGDMLGLKHHALHAGPEVKGGITRQIAVVVMSIDPPPTPRLHPEQLDASDCLESLGAAGLARAYRSSLGEMLTAADVIRRLSGRAQPEVIWNNKDRQLLASEGCTDADVERLAKIAGKKRSRSWGE